MKKHLIIIFIMAISFAKAQQPNTWTRLPNFVGIARENSISFNTDSFGYVGLGVHSQDTFPYAIDYLNDLWQYNPYINSWKQKASFPGLGRENSVCFVIDSKVYVGTGDENGIGSGGYSDFWQYDPANDTWTQKADFGGGGRTSCLAFSIGGKGYVGMGYSDTASRYKKDMWEYDPIADTWTQLNDFPGIGVGEGSIFTIGGQEYIGFGVHDTNSQFIEMGDLWRYDTSDSWIQLANFTPDTLNGEVLAAYSFSLTIGGNGYVDVLYDSSASISNLSDNVSRYFYEYNPLLDSWVQKDSFPDSMKFGMSFFSMGNKGYVGIGTPTNMASCSTDFWMYNPDSINTGIKPLNQTGISIYPDPATDRIYINNLPPLSTLSVCDLTGRSVNTIATGSEIDVSALPAGIYLLHIQSSGGDSFVKKFTKL